MKETLQKLKRACACLFIFIGGFGLPTALLSLASPFNAQLQNASDPLSAPVSRGESYLIIGTYLVMLIIGIWLAISCRREESND